ncbi:hypothetical protein [Bradyrhizobium sp. AUGA SZCCT0182]|uniref:hypothetical protein n=1 Tax=Bradyrhizobium sp. AUGA SZCCT0182 TaxID=2807667 RepID=UPI001BAAAE15|nr:hypothetical protein [Bradyrhizobium sp. AUGA SZCCT0182]MBR1238174.1 hypothetical protein [Bradyrhizobium sp. AUGA SZCCT0182]
MTACPPSPHPERSDCWHVYYGDVQVGTIGKRAGAPNNVDQWGWTCGFHPATQRGVFASGTAVDFETARLAFERAWQTIQPSCTEADFAQLPPAARLEPVETENVGNRVQITDAVCGRPGHGITFDWKGLAQVPS